MINDRFSNAFQQKTKNPVMLVNDTVTDGGGGGGNVHFFTFLTWVLQSNGPLDQWGDQAS